MTASSRADLTQPVDALFVNARFATTGVDRGSTTSPCPVLDMGYIATYATCAGFNVGVIDAEAHGLPVADAVELINAVAPGGLDSTCWPQRTRSAPPSRPDFGPR